jgi:hypothetical protein
LPIIELDHRETTDKAKNSRALVSPKGFEWWTNFSADDPKLKKFLGSLDKSDRAGVFVSKSALDITGHIISSSVAVYVTKGRKPYYFRLLDSA